ncbi:hypothetical protein DdX_11516 [Ditylenchus destructor]|uniref:Uncharacterized protein n=1 Tax=Ditylenchus destructor TaxID=166010 RepID=A0AAD4N2G7_9BILA|nr:hypothetical protein DdX_11516 [Ditylenchus destructor]
MLKQSIDKRNQASGGTSTEGDDDNGQAFEGDYGKKTPNGRKTPARRFRYSMQEERQMWDYFLREYRAGNKSAKIKTTLQLWKEFVEEVSPEKAKKPSGMESHFRRQMLPNVMKYKKFISDDDFFLVLRHFEVRIKTKHARKLEKNFTYRVETHPDGTFKNAIKNSEEEALRLRLEDARNPQSLHEDSDDSDMDNGRTATAMSKGSDEPPLESSKRKRGRPAKVKSEDTPNVSRRSLRSAKSEIKNQVPAEADNLTSQLSTPIADEKPNNANHTAKRSMRKRAATPFKSSIANKEEDAEPAPKQKPSETAEVANLNKTIGAQRTSASYASLQSMQPKIAVLNESPDANLWDGSNYPARRADEEDVYADNFGYITPSSSAISNNSDAYFGGYVRNTTYAWSANCMKDSLYAQSMPQMYALPSIAHVYKQNSAALASSGVPSSNAEPLKVSEQSAFQRITPTSGASPVITPLEENSTPKTKVSSIAQPRKSKLSLEIVSLGTVEYNGNKLEYVKLPDVSVVPASNDENKKPELVKKERCNRNDGQQNAQKTSI